jgi:hypothetical protein
MIGLFAAVHESVNVLTGWRFRQGNFLSVRPMMWLAA